MLLTGATGFLGSHLVEELQERGIAATCLARQSSDTGWLEQRGLPVQRVSIQALTPELMAAVSGHDTVIHVAGAVRALDYPAFVAANADATEALLQACLRAPQPVRRFVLVSSVGATGPPPPGQLLTESSAPTERTDYGRSKWEGEQRVLALKHAIQVVILRPTALYGPRDSELLPLFRLARTGLLPAFAGPQQIYNLCHARDAARAIVLATTAELPSGEIFQVGCQQELSAAELAELLGRLLQRRVLLLPLPGWLLWLLAACSESWARLTHRPAMLNRQKIPELTGSWRLDLSHAREQLGFNSSWDPTRGLAETLRWYQSQGLL